MILSVAGVGEFNPADRAEIAVNHRSNRVPNFMSA